MLKLYEKGNHSNCYTELSRTAPGLEWREGMVSGNGEEGYVTSGAPYEDTFIFQNMWFNFPSAHPRFIPPELPGQLGDARQAVFLLDDQWEIPEVLPDGSVRRRIRTFYYSFHPGMQLRLSMEHRKENNYIRWTNMETAETGVRFTDEKGTWIRTAFSSRADGVSVIRLRQSSAGEPLSLTLSIDRVSDMSKAYDGATTVSALRYFHLAGEEPPYLAQVGHYPSYAGSELVHGGYACAARVIAKGGSVRRIALPCEPETMRLGPAENPALRVEGAREVILLVKSARTHEMGRMEDFEKAESFPLVERLLEAIDGVAARYAREGDPFAYADALAAHTALHRREWEKASLRLAAPCNLPNETLLARQKAEKNRLIPELLEKIWEQARYAQICCSGASAPRLCGMWTGEWQPGWRGIYTLDANVNLQVAGMNVAHMEYAALGYVIFLLRNTPDWVLNAKMSYGIEKGLQVSVNSDIDRGMHVEYDNDYPFEYWNAGASWCLLPLYEFWQCNGDRSIPLDDRMRIDEAFCAMGMPEERLSRIHARGTLSLLRDVLLPLLRCQANFWEGLCTPEYFTDTDGNARYEKGKQELLPGERYLLIPCYSPENHPLGYCSTLTANATMDISAARDGLHMAITAEREAGEAGWQDRVAAWENLIERLPEYRLDETGALREWAMKEYQENNNHRHISHLYPAWPAYETKRDPALAEAAEQALLNRERYNVDDDTAGHGWMHRALVEARLGHGEKAEQALLSMAVNQGYYSSLMTDHDTNRRMGCYCTDTLFGTAAVLQEMLLFSNTGEMELLPALPDTLSAGSVRGLMARTRAEVVSLEWDCAAKTAAAVLRSETDQTIRVSFTIAPNGSMTQDGKAVPNGSAVSFETGQTIAFRFTW